MSSEAPVQVTCEEVPRGDLPDWLTEHLSKQSLGPTGAESDLSGRVMVVYPTEESRKQALAQMPPDRAIDSTLHHTIEISVPPNLTRGEELPPIRVRGMIDRVDILPMDQSCQVWLDSEGDSSIAPLRVNGSGWRPRRLVAIRDLKTSESRAAKHRHFDGLLDELQLALYARAWEVSHPGDLVVAAGISLFSHDTEHVLEVSSQYSAAHEDINIGTRTDITASLHRFADEPPSPSSDHFRAWLAQRLAVALRVASGAAAGRVHPTPSAGVCGYCPVRNVCDVRMEGGF